MTREDLIREVASSIYKKRNGSGCKHFNSLPNSHKNPYLQDAEAAIDAIYSVIKQPTHGHMIVAQGLWLDDPHCDLSTLWQAMLAASPLAPEKKK